MNAPAKFTIETASGKLLEPGWMTCQPVDLLRVYATPDGVGRTLHMGMYVSRMMAEDVANEAYDVFVWSAPDAKGRQQSACGGYRIQPVST